MAEKLVEQLNDTFALPETHAPGWQLNEFASPKKVVDGDGILGRVVGPMFAPNGDSLNGRHYTKKLWELALQRNADRLKSGKVIGTVGHDVDIHDVALGEGKISHKVANMWIDDKTGVGMGEIHIVNTDAGRNLYGLLRGGINLQVSTRATGTLSNRKTTSGLPIIDEDSYSFQGIDFVSAGGIPTASPKLVETANEFLPNDKLEHGHTTVVPPNDSPNKEIKMSDVLLETLAKDKINLTKSLDEATSANNALIAENNALRLEAGNRQKEVDRVVGTIDEAKAEIGVLKADLLKANEALEALKAFGDVAKLSEDLTKFRTLAESYDEFGSVEDLTQAFEKVDEMVEQYKVLGSPTTLTTLLGELDVYSNMGRADAIEEKLAILEKYTAVTSVDNLNTMVSLLQGYEPFGSPTDIAEAFDAVDRAFAVLKQKEIKADAVELARKFKMKPEKVEEMISKNGKEYTVSFLEDLFESDASISNRYVVTKSVDAPAKIAESHTPTEETPREVKPLGMKLMERLSRNTPESNNNRI